MSIEIVTLLGNPVDIFYRQNTWQGILTLAKSNLNESSRSFKHKSDSKCFLSKVLSYDWTLYPLFHAK